MSIKKIVPLFVFSSLLAPALASEIDEIEVIDSEETISQQAEDEFDASDLTRAITSGYVGMSNKGDVKASGSIAYSLKNGQMAMGTMEVSLDGDGDYKDSRAQYFHVFNTGNKTSPRVAASVDIINNNQFTTAAFGAISLAHTPYKPLTFFARGAALVGEYDQDFAKSLGASNTDIVGGMGAVYAVLKTGQDGTFLAAFPEYTYLDGDISMSNLKTTFLAATPMSADGKRWGQVRFESTQTDITDAKGTKHSVGTDNVVWFNYKVFF